MEKLFSTPSTLRPLLFAALVLATACGGGGGFQLSPVTPQSGVNVQAQAASVSVDPAMAADQQEIMTRYQVAAEMQRVLALSTNARTGVGPTINTTVTSIRFSRFGPTRMHSRTEVVAPDGSVLKSFENESVSMRSRALEHVAQDHVQRIVDSI